MQITLTVLNIQVMTDVGVNLLQATYFAYIKVNPLIGYFSLGMSVQILKVRLDTERAFSLNL